jgi:hypothetical protein
MPWIDNHSIFVPWDPELRERFSDKYGHRRMSDIRTKVEQQYNDDKEWLNIPLTILAAIPFIAVLLLPITIVGCIIMAMMGYSNSAGAWFMIHLIVGMFGFALFWTLHCFCDDDMSNYSNIEKLVDEKLIAILETDK